MAPLEWITYQPRKNGNQLISLSENGKFKGDVYASKRKVKEKGFPFKVQTNGARGKEKVKSWKGSRSEGILAEKLLLVWE